MDPLTVPDESIAALERVAAEAQSYLAELTDAPVRSASSDEAAERFGGRLPDEGVGTIAAIEELLRDGIEAHVRSGGPRFFHWVIGGSTPAALAADWVTSLLDQNAGGWDATPLGARLEHISIQWLLDLFELPAEWSGVLTTGATTANFAGPAAGAGPQQPVHPRLRAQSARDARARQRPGDRLLRPGRQLRPRAPRRGPGRRAHDRDRQRGRGQRGPLRPDPRGRSDRAQAQRLGTRRRRLRPLRASLAPRRRTRGRRRAGRLRHLGRPQVAERPVRLRLRVRPRPRLSPCAVLGRSRVPARGQGRAAGVRLHGPRALAARPLARRLGDAACLRPRRLPRDRRALPRQRRSSRAPRRRGGRCRAAPPRAAQHRLLPLPPARRSRRRAGRPQPRDRAGDPPRRARLPRYHPLERRRRLPPRLR